MGNIRVSRESLEQISERYLKALVANDPAAAPLAAGVAFAENDQRLPVGSASWRTIDGLGRYRHVFCDLEAETVGAIANVTENGVGAVIVLRLKLQEGLIVEAEQFVVRDPGAYDRYEELGTPEDLWFEPIPPAQRQTREALEAMAWMYFQALYRNDGAGIYPFTDDCQRLEHARPSVNRPSNESYGHADNTVDFVTLKARQQYALGMMGYISGVRDRRVLAVDVERGAVLSSCCFDFDGMTRRINLTGGGVFEIPAYFRTPRTHHMNEAFKIQNGSFRYIEMLLLEVPYATRPVWLKVPTSTQVPVDVRPESTPMSKVDRGVLTGLTDRLLDAFVTCSPWSLPLSDSVVYLENGVAVEPGDGLWKSISGRGAYHVYLADADSGAAGFYGTLDENGRLAVVALRMQVRDGLITEIEVVIARPERADEWGNLKEATHSMFVPPLLADVNSRAFDAPDERLLRAAGKGASRDELLGVVDRYYEGWQRHRSDLVPFAVDCMRRENGVAAAHSAEGVAVDRRYPDFRLFTESCAAEMDRGYLASLSVARRRPLVVDAEAGLVLDLALFDYPGSARSVSVAGVGEVGVPPAFASPVTDMHATLFKIEDGLIGFIESAVRRVPYGQTSLLDPQPPD